MPDLVNHPPHYGSHPSGVECIRITEHYNFNVGNAIKYLWRAGLKDGVDPVEDLRKAEWYVHREIHRLTATEEPTSTAAPTVASTGSTETMPLSIDGSSSTSP